MMLSGVKKHQKVVVEKIKGGRNLLSRLNSLGIIPGANIFVMENNSGGPILIKVNESLLSLGRGICTKIFIKQ
jgi:Fe2+ transport system protein FeoA